MNGAKRAVAILAAFASMFAIVSAAQTETAAQASADAADTLAVTAIIDERHLSDRDRESLYRLLLGSVSDDQWLTFVVPTKTTVPLLLNAWYDYFAKPGQGSTPRTTALLADRIRRFNGLDNDDLARGTEISLPPIPVRAHSDYRKAAIEYREFDPTDGWYSLVAPTGAEQIASASSRINAGVASIDALRDGIVTRLKLKIRRGNLVQTATGASVPASVIVESPGGFDVVHLLGTSAKCTDDPAAWLSQSPYLAEAKRLISGVDHNTLTTSAAKQPLAMIDWDITSGHGKLVQKVIYDVLDQLGLSYLEDPRYVQAFELNPAIAKKNLKQTVDEYKNYYVANQNWDHVSVDAAFKDAEKWLDAYVPPPDIATTQRLHSLVMQSIMHHFMTRQSLFNLSFYVESSALQAIEQHYLLTSRSIGVLASGDSGTELSTVMMPQLWAAHAPNLMNVTFGRRDGTIDGDFSSAALGTSVSLVAPGCGYQGFSDDVRGSSFASPYVATAIWVASLLRSLAVTELKSTAIAASRLSPPRASTVDSRGIFDAAFLLARPGPHFVQASDGRAVPFASLSLTLSGTLEAVGGLGSYTEGLPRLGGSDPSHPNAIAPFACQQSGVCVWARVWDKQRKQYMNTSYSSLVSVSIVAKDQQGTVVLDVKSPPDLIAKVSQLYF